jgi:purine-binding chemotaxis protein CheW
MAKTDILEEIEEKTQEKTQKFLLFPLAEETYGLSISHIINIIEIQKITVVPEMPPFLKGVINLRGQVIPVIDLRLRFGLNERPYDDRTCIIIIQRENTVLGLIVDTVAEVISIEESQIVDQHDSKKSSIDVEYLDSLAKVGDSVYLLLSTQELLKKAGEWSQN